MDRVTSGYSLHVNEAGITAEGGHAQSNPPTFTIQANLLDVTVFLSRDTNLAVEQATVIVTGAHGLLRDAFEQREAANAKASD